MVICNYIGTKQAASSYYLDGIMAHVHISDGYAYQASDFGETDTDTNLET